jgi:hypothetical protein
MKALWQGGFRERWFGWQGLYVEYAHNQTHAHIPYPARSGVTPAVANGVILAADGWFEVGVAWITNTIAIQV